MATIAIKICTINTRRRHRLFWEAPISTVQQSTPFQPTGAKSTLCSLSQQTCSAEIPQRSRKKIPRSIRTTTTTKNDRNYNEWEMYRIWRAEIAGRKTRGRNLHWIDWHREKSSDRDWGSTNQEINPISQEITLKEIWTTVTTKIDRNGIGWNGCRVRREEIFRWKMSRRNLYQSERHREQFNDWNLTSIESTNPHLTMSRFNASFGNIVS